MIKNVTILGARESGFGAAMLASKKGYNVFVSDINQIDDNIKLLFEDNFSSKFKCIEDLFKSKAKYSK